MDYNIIDKTDGGQDEYSYTISIKRSEFKGLANEIKEYLESQGSMEGGVVIRENKRNPVIKSDGQRIYLEWRDDRADIDLSMSDEVVRRNVGDFLGDGDQSHADSMTESIDRKWDTDNDETQADENWSYSRRDVPPGEEEVFKPFSHEEAGYRRKDNPNFNHSRERCRDCAHWDDHGNCRIVRGANEDEYCEEYFADVGFFASAGEGIGDPAGKGRRPSVNLTLWGEESDRIGLPDSGTVELIIQKIRDAFEERLK